MLNIITAPNPILSQSAKQISKINSNILKLIDQMKQTLLAAKDPEGVGLAAPQVGKSLQIFLVKPTAKPTTQAFINPKIKVQEKTSHLTETHDRGQQLNDTFAVNSVKQSEKTARAKERSGIDKNVQLEGCLSLPNIWGEVKRSPAISLSYLDAQRKSHSRTFRGLLATIIQHEMDHLDGILFPKRVLEQKGKLYKSHKNEKNEDVFEEIEI